MSSKKPEDISETIPPDTPLTSALNTAAEAGGERPPASDFDDNEKYSQFYSTAAYQLFELFISSYVSEDSMSDFGIQSLSIRNRGLIEICAGRFISIPTDDGGRETSVHYNTFKPDSLQDLAGFMEDLNKVAMARYVTGIQITAHDMHYAIEVGSPDALMRLIQSYVTYFKVTTLDDLSTTMRTDRKVKQIIKETLSEVKTDLCEGLCTKWGQSADVVDISQIPVNAHSPTLDNAAKGLLVSQSIQQDVAMISLHVLEGILRDCKGLTPRHDMGPALLH